MRTLVILNPTAAGRTDAAALRRLVAAHVDADFEVTVEPGHAERLAADAARSDYDLVIAAGGDGTVREVATGLFRGGGSPRLGVIPVGTGNDLAHGLGLPRDVGAAVSVAVSGREVPLDLIRAWSDGPARGDRFLANAAVAGFAGRISDSMSPVLRRRLRPVAYPVAAVGQLGRLREHRVRLDLDGRVLESSAFMIIVANGEYAGGRLRLAPGASYSDARMDVVIVRAVPAWRLSTLVPRVLMGRHAGDPAVSIHRGQRLRLEAEPPMWINLDGDTWLEGSARFAVEPGALRVAVP